MRLDTMTQLDVAMAFRNLDSADACSHCLLFQHYGDTCYCDCAHGDCCQILYEFLTEDKDMEDVKKLAKKIGIHKLYTLVKELRGE